jgi:hypothetical protein
MHTPSNLQNNGDVPVRKQIDRFRIARKALFITAAFLRTVRDLHGGVL